MVAEGLIKDNVPVFCHHMQDQCSQITIMATTACSVRTGRKRNEILLRRLYQKLCLPEEKHCILTTLATAGSLFYSGNKLSCISEGFKLKTLYSFYSPLRACRILS